jgi:HK97 gp10 family phage protein
MISLEIKGIEELTAKLEALGKNGTKKVMRQAMRAAMKPMLDAVKSKIPVETGEMKRNVKLRALKRSRTQFGYKVELADPTGELGAVPIEYGWKTAKAKHKIEGQGNIRQAFELTKYTSLETAQNLIKEGIEGEMK